MLAAYGEGLSLTSSGQLGSRAVALGTRLVCSRVDPIQGDERLKKLDLIFVFKSLLLTGCIIRNVGEQRSTIDLRDRVATGSATASAEVSVITCASMLHYL